jgi:DNA ligase (NAD+)
MPEMENLNQRLEEARRAYYAGDPIMSDAEYDALEAELKGLAKDAQPSVLTTVGTDAPGRIPHKHPMRSIENVYSIEEAVAWAKIPVSSCSVSSKWDGVSCSLTYEQGVLVKAVTRGDGTAGESILDQVIASKAVPVHLEGTIYPLLEIRGELVMRRSALEALNQEILAAGGKPYVSTRNLVAGTVKLKDMAEVAKRQIEFRSWEVIGEPGDLTINFHQWSSGVGMLKLITQYGFAEPDDVLVTNAEQLKQEIESRIPGLSDPNQEIGRDGIVIKVDSLLVRQQLGYGSKFANFQIAFKAQNAKTETVLKDVIWQVGRQGRLTPVGIVEPVVLAGATIERVTLNNLTWINEMGLEIGSRVIIMRSGDVIPKIVEVLGGE